MKSVRGHTALVFLFRSDSAYLVNFESKNFRTLFEAEFEIRDVQGWTTLMHLCHASPNLLKNYFWFIEPLLKQASVITKHDDSAITCFIRNIRKFVDFNSYGFMRLWNTELHGKKISAEYLICHAPGVLNLNSRLISKLLNMEI